MKSILIVVIVSTFAYSSVGALMKAVETQKSHAEQIKNAALMMR